MYWGEGGTNLGIVISVIVYKTKVVELGRVICKKEAFFVGTEHYYLRIVELTLS